MGLRNFDKIDLNINNFRVSIFDLFSIHVLIVTDSDVTYGEALGGTLNPQFGLKEVVRALTHPAGGAPWIRVTKAHRHLDPLGTGSGTARVTPANIENFTFSAASLAGFDQVWLFGAEHAFEGPSIAGAEVQALTHFMNAGGGVFATGDHADLGVTLSGGVPRLRSMRKWFFPGAGPNGEPVAPDPVNANRFDTTRPNPPGQFPFDNQSDVIPMPIVPTWWGFGIWRYPHPLLCGHKGVIDVMPDHMHEGEIITPDGADAASGWSGSGVPGGMGTTLNINGEMIIEYPSKDGHQERPVIVAQADVIGGHTTPSTEGHTGSSTNTNARRFACIGAYDGLRSGVGRVAVDSTWHHFFDLNVVGDPTAPAPKNLGFNATPAGQEALARIDNYYVNIATWLSPDKGYFFIGWLVAALRGATARELVPMARVMDARFTLHIGDAIYADLRRFLPPCAILDIVVIQYLEIAKEWGLPDPPDPWAANPRDIVINPNDWAAAALGGMAVELHEALFNGKGLRGKETQAVMQRGLAKGLHTYAQTQAENAKAVMGHAEQLLKPLAQRMDVMRKPA